MEQKYDRRSLLATSSARVSTSSLNLSSSKASSGSRALLKYGSIEWKKPCKESLSLMAITGSNGLADLESGVAFFCSTSQMNLSVMKNKIKQEADSRNCSAMQAPFRTKTQLPFCRS